MLYNILRDYCEYGKKYNEWDKRNNNYTFNNIFNGNRGSSVSDGLGVSVVD